MTKCCNAPVHPIAGCLLVCLLGACTALLPSRTGQVDATAGALDSAGSLANVDAVADSGTDADVPVIVGKKALKIDFLWVIDHSSSMCSHQADLSDGFMDFTKSLQKAGQIDAQMAVVSVQQIADRDPTTQIIHKVGQFLHKPAIKFPPSCIERFQIPCSEDSQCQNGMDFTFKADTICPQSSSCTDPSGNLAQHFDNKYQSVSCAGDPTCQWRCKAPPNNPKLLAVNDNCSVNSYCWRHCKDKQECRDVFEPNVPAAQQRMECFCPGDACGADSGCQFPPPTSDCPTEAELPAVLKYNQLDLFHCIATVGASQSPESRVEGGLRSAWLALDPDGPNCPHGQATTDNPKGTPTAVCQYNQLLRPDAYLVIVVVSDDDDCSVDLDISLDNATPEQVAALKKTLPLEDYDSCQKFGDKVGGNQWLNEGNCESLKGNPGQPKRCPCDCRALTAQKYPSSQDPVADGQKDPEIQACWSEVQADLAKYAKIDSRFASVDAFVSKFKSLKSDPVMVMFAAVTGFSKMGKPGQDPLHPGDKSYADGVAYYKSLLKNTSTGQAATVCAGVRGNAGFGSRYVQVADAFKENGVVVNICEGADFGAQLQTIGTTILQRVVKH